MFNLLFFELCSSELCYTYLLPILYIFGTYLVPVQYLSSTYPVLIQYLSLKQSQFLYFYSVAGPQHHITHNNSRFIALAAAELFNYFLLLGTTLLLPLTKVCLKQLSLPISTAITTYNNGLIDPTCGLRQYLCINVIMIRFCFDTTNLQASYYLIQKMILDTFN